MTQSAAPVQRVLEGFGAALTAAGYTEEGIVGATGAPDIDAIVSGEAAHALAASTPREPVELLVHAFLMGRRVRARDIVAALPGVDLGGLAAAGVIEKAGDVVTPALRIMPFAGLLIASTPDTVGDAGVSDDFVMGVGMSSITLANLTMRDEVRTVLDLGCGSGIQSLLAARHAQTVIGLDRNHRAVRLARLNAMLNGVRHVQCAVGDLTEPVRDSAFELIVCNPPMVVSPDSRYLYRDSPHPGDGLCAQLVRTVPRHLRDGGFFQVLCHWVHVDGERWQDRVARWCERSGCDVWALQAEVSDAHTYAATWVGTTEQGSPQELSATLMRWMRWMEQEGIEAIGSGLISMRRTTRDPAWFRADELPDAMSGPCGDHVRRVFAAQDFLEAHRDDSRLLGARLRAVPEVRREVQSTPGEGAWRVVATRLRLNTGLGWSAQVDPAVAELVGMCDGVRTVGEILAMLPVGGASERALAAVRKLIERGFLTSG